MTNDSADLKVFYSSGERERERYIDIELKSRVESRVESRVSFVFVRSQEPGQAISHRGLLFLEKERCAL